MGVQLSGQSSQESGGVSLQESDPELWRKQSVFRICCRPGGAWRWVLSSVVGWEWGEEEALEEQREPWEHPMQAEMEKGN